MQPKRVLIVGAGFGGIAAALALEKNKPSNLKIVLVSAKPHFEYRPALYRVVTGKSPLEVCIPIREIVEGKAIEFAVDLIQGVDFSRRIARGASDASYAFDYLILALGSETAYFNIPGLEEFSFGFKSIAEALRLKRHLHKLFEDCSKEKNPDEKVCLLHFVIVGAGASGVELAGELSQYSRKLAKEHGVGEELLTIDLIEATGRILPALASKISEKAARRLHHLGVNIFTGRPMEAQKLEEIKVRGLTLKTETVIWTAGVKPNSLYQKISGLAFDQKGRILVDEYLRVKNFKNIFAIGDGASTLYSGMAQTAIHDGQSVAENILRDLEARPLFHYQPKKPYHVIPIGSGWAAASLGPIMLYGPVGWFFRRFADFRYFLSILPFKKALLAFRSGKTLCESCEICLPES